jgi:Uma2 family endonuclease
MLAMMAAGVIDSGGPEELLDGEIWVMPSEGPAHGDLKAWLNELLILHKLDDVGVACGSTLRLSETSAPSPDFYVFPAALRPSQVRGPDTLLVIEIADTTTRKDLALKAPIYRAAGVRQYWVVDVVARVTHVHRLEGGWPEAPPTPFEANLAPNLIPGLTLRLADSGA